MAVAVLGDVGGQTQVYRDALESIGVDADTGIIPDGLTLVQVGDVVRMNTSADLDSLGCAQISDRLIEANPTRFFQLLGNHDLALLGGVHSPDWKISDLPESRPILEKWWDKEQVVLGVALESSKEADQDILITHAGMGFNYWNSLGGGDASTTAKNLNALVGTAVAEFEKPGYLVTDLINPEADTAWAIVGREFQDTWTDEVMPYHQIHGHSVMLEWDSNHFWSNVPQHIIDSTVVNYEDRFTLTTRPDNRWIRSVDWVLKNRLMQFNWPVLVLEDYVVKN